MLTVKLQRGATTKIVECFGVQVTRTAGAQTLELDVLSHDGGRVKDTYYVSSAQDPDHYAVAYVENAGGATTQVVRAV